MNNIQASILLIIVSTFCSAVWYYFFISFLLTYKNHFKNITKYRNRYRSKGIFFTFYFSWFGFVPVYYVIMMFLTIWFIVDNDKTAGVPLIIMEVGYIFGGTMWYFWFLRRRRQAYIFQVNKSLVFSAIIINIANVQRIDFNKTKRYFFMSLMMENKRQERVRFKNMKSLEAFIREVFPKSQIIVHRYTSA